MKRRISLAVAVVLGFCSTAVFADWAKIGVVDLQKIMQTSSQMKTVQQKLETEFKPRRDKLVALEQKLKKDMEAFKRDLAVLSADQKKEKEKQIISAQQTFEREGQQYQQELSSAHNEAMEGLYTKIRATIAKIAETDKYDVIFQKDAAPFSVDKLDITSQVIKQLG